MVVVIHLDLRWNALTTDVGTVRLVPPRQHNRTQSCNASTCAWRLDFAWIEMWGAPFGVRQVPCLHRRVLIASRVRQVTHPPSGRALAGCGLHEPKGAAQWSIEPCARSNTKHMQRRKRKKQEKEKKH